jgi:hypothetical protein
MNGVPARYSATPFDQDSTNGGSTIGDDAGPGTFRYRAVADGLQQLV